VTVELEPVAAIPGAPLAVAAPSDGTGRLFVTERGGRVWIVQDGQRSETTFLDIANRIVAGGEQGLLGFAFHPAFPEDPRFFIYYTDKERDQVVAERRVDPADPDRADPGYERELLRMDDFAANHNGGGLGFGPDGYLYIATGDGGGAGDPQGTGQRLDTHLAKILRIDVGAPADGAAYGIPDDNPFVDEDGALPEIWHTGLRNPWRFSFDRETGDLWIGDVGQGAWEEIDVARGGAGGVNFGWSVTEGRHCFRSDDCSAEGMTPPVTEYGHDLGCSVTGGVVYRGAEFPDLRGAYLFADYCTGVMWAIDATADQVPEPTVVLETGRSISSFGEDENGEVYVTDLGGELLRVVGTSG
jgi:glucose/arabinose dehydrogenase